ncbi:MAG: protein kinase [Thermoanaerobaculaceae bacterium]
MQPGSRIAHFEVLGLIGAGGMGEVYRARDTRLGRDVAIKVLPAEFAADPERLRRFEQEARAVAALNHPNILVVYDVGTHEGAPYLVEELLDGESLRERLQGGALPPRKVVELAVQVCSGLAAAHEKGIVHRDLKPENLFVTSDGHVKILDFGVAKLKPVQPDQAAAPTVVDTTQPGMVIGTVAYMSPEQVRGQSVDHRSDIFSLGCVLYEMLTGRRAFAHDTAADTMSSILREEPLEVSAAQPGVPAPLAHVVSHCLEKRQEERFQSARDLAFGLAAVTGVGSAPTAVAGGGPAGRRLLALGAAGIGLAAAALAAGFFLLGRQTKRPPEAPRFTRLTFQRGYIRTARFAPDGTGVLFSAGWGGHPADVFETRTDRAATRSLGLEGIQLLAVSRTAQLALLKGSLFFGWGYGSLAEVPLSGSAPRFIAEDVSAADWAPDGTTLAIVRRVANEVRLEMPPGRVLVRTPGYFEDVRISRDGRRIGFTEHAVLGDGRGSVALVDADGHKTTLTREFTNVAGLAWSADGREIWFSAQTAGMQQQLFAVTPDGRQRRLQDLPSRVFLHDVAPDGRVLLASGTAQTGIRGRSQEDDREKELGWLDFPWLRALSADGGSLLFDDQGETAGPRYSVYLRSMDGSLPVRLGEGAACALAPDGRWALAINYGPPHRLVLLPTGSGETISLPRGQVETYQTGNFLPDGRRVIFVGAEPGRPQRTWVQEILAGLPRAVTPEGTVGTTTSPDGRWVATVTADFTLTLFPLDGGKARSLTKLDQRDAVSQWSEDGRTLFVYGLGERLDVFGVDVGTGEKRLWRTFELPDPAGASIGSFAVTRDARSYAYGYLRFLDELYLVEGLR